MCIYLYKQIHIHSHIYTSIHALGLFKNAADGPLLLTLIERPVLGLKHMFSYMYIYKYIYIYMHIYMYTHTRSTQR